jgi:hypothetical protein
MSADFSFSSKVNESILLKKSSKEELSFKNNKKIQY